MITQTLTLSTSLSYSLTMIKDEVRQLLEKGLITRQQHIYHLCEYIPPREWSVVESELEKADFLLRDRIGELISTETWYDD
jgi:predicted transcriptional regulator